MLTKDLLVVILEDEHVLGVVPGTLLPDGPQSTATPEQRVGCTRIGQFAVFREGRRIGRPDLILQARGRTRLANVDLVADKREGDRIDRRGPDDVVQLRHDRFTWLSPSGIEVGEGIVSPQTVGATGGRAWICPIVNGVASHESGPLGDVPVETSVDLVPIDGHIQRRNPVVAIPGIVVIGSRIESQEGLTRLANIALRNDVTRIRIAGRRVDRHWTTGGI